MKKIVIFNMKTAGFLMLNKFPLRKIEPSNKNPNMNVFIFDDTPELRQKISEYDAFLDFTNGYLAE